MSYTNSITRAPGNPPQMGADDVSALIPEDFRGRKVSRMNKMPMPVGGYKLPSGRASVIDAADAPVKKAGATKKTGVTKGKSNALGHGGRAQQLRDRGVPEGVIGAIARAKGAAPGQAHYHPSKAASGKKGK